MTHDDDDDVGRQTEDHPKSSPWHFVPGELKSIHRQIMASESNQNVFFIQKDTLCFAEFEISEFEISRVDCSTIDEILILK